jgi:hypothetical protein
MMCVKVESFVVKADTDRPSPSWGVLQIVTGGGW